jgi:hypothetical protein
MTDSEYKLLDALSEATAGWLVSMLALWLYAWGTWAHDKTDAWMWLVTVVVNFVAIGSTYRFASNAIGYVKFLREIMEKRR